MIRKGGRAKKESETCAYCQVKLGSKELNERVQYYQEQGFSWEGYPENTEAP